MKLSIRQIDALLPNTSCGDCGFLACMAFAAHSAEKMDLELDLCPHVSEEAKAQLSEFLSKQYTPVISVDALKYDSCRDAHTFGFVRYSVYLNLIEYKIRESLEISAVPPVRSSTEELNRQTILESIDASLPIPAEIVITDLFADAANANGKSQYEKANGIYRQVLDIDPQNALAAGMLGISAFLDYDDIIQSTLWFSRAASFGSPHSMVYQYLIEIYTTVGISPSEKYQAMAYDGITDLTSDTRRRISDLVSRTDKQKIRKVLLHNDRDNAIPRTISEEQPRINENLVRGRNIVVHIRKNQMRKPPNGRGIDGLYSEHRPLYAYIAKFEDGTEKAYDINLDGGYKLRSQSLLFLTENEIHDFYYSPIINKQRELIRILMTERITIRDVGTMYDVHLSNSAEREEVFNELVRNRFTEAIPAIGKLFLEDIGEAVANLIRDKESFKKIYRNNNFSKHAKAIIEIGGEQEFDRIMLEIILPFLSWRVPNISQHKLSKKQNYLIISYLITRYGNIGKWYLKKKRKWWEFGKPKLQL